MRRVGSFMVLLGVLGLAGAGVLSAVAPAINAGGTAAVGLFLIILGLVYSFPSLLTDDTGATSTMRVAVLMIVALFVVLTTKAGWGATDLAHLDLQKQWAWVLAAALGGKAAQSLAENLTPAAPSVDGAKPAPRPALAPAPRKPAARDELAGIEDTP
jgi:hypothetical protein